MKQGRTIRYFPTYTTVKYYRGYKRSFGEKTGWTNYRFHLTLFALIGLYFLCAVGVKTLLSGPPTDIHTKVYADALADPQPVASPPANVTVGQPEQEQGDTGKDAVDIYVADAINEFYPNDPGKDSEMRMIMHCLLYYETKHDYSKGFGDGGMAGGPLQFWEDTWVGMRQQMIDQGVATTIGSRLDLKEAIRTTVWAIKSGRGNDWGPIYRTLRGETWNTCPAPSWY